MKIAITGASGKTGYRISEEAVKKGYKVRQIIRKTSKVSEGLESLETIRVSLDNKKELDKAFKDIDAVLTPSTPNSAFKIGDKTSDPVSMYLNDIFTVPVNLAGLPALSMPAGVDNQGYPLGLQLIGKALDEQKILNIGYAFEKNCGFKNEIKKWWS